MRHMREGCVRQLLEWTGKRGARTLFDTDRDGWDSGRFFEAVRGRADLAFVNVTAGGSVFGCCTTVPVVQRRTYTEDPRHFVFAFRTSVGVSVPVRVFHTPNGDARALYLSDSQDDFYTCGYAGHFNIGEPASEYNYCYNVRVNYSLPGVALAGKQPFVVRRLLVVQLLEETW